MSIWQIENELQDTLCDLELTKDEYNNLFDLCDKLFKVKSPKEFLNTQQEIKDYIQTNRRH